ncbi:Hsp20/alpha crystallin family protein [Bacillus alveayuensis]|uniref:Hsp20/alpha crystallin family protein n=1 Tax=Aeribacillus alveayuensis TaxID=279215 RepID=UPI0005D1016D|nr:Hsp20/alpha crystallin family protein [Bacillus alveayuensis]
MKSKKSVTEFEKWLEILLADPFTDYLDETMFRVDVFETGEDYIIEAELPHYAAQQIQVKCHDHAVIIQTCEKNEVCKERTVLLPFHLADKHVSACFEKGVLEVRINKETIGEYRDNIKYIPIIAEDDK